MSYVDQAQDPRRRATAIIGVAAIHAAIGAGLIVGLTVSGVAPPVDIWDPFEITPDRPKPPPPEPSPTQSAEQSVVVIPPTPLPPISNTENQLVRDEPVASEGTALAAVDRPIIAPIPQPLQTTLFTPRKARPSNDPLRWITTEDYPARALRAEAEGLAAYRLIVATNGRVSACEVTRSTGNGQLDDATCDFIARRARFEAATDETGAKVVGGYTGTVRWQIPE